MIFTVATLLFFVALLFFIMVDRGGHFFWTVGVIALSLGTIAAILNWMLQFSIPFRSTLVYTEPIIQRLFTQPYGLQTWQHAVAAGLFLIISTVFSDLDDHIDRDTKS